MCTNFIALYSYSHTLFPKTAPSHWYQLSLMGRICSGLMFFDFVEEKREKIK
jgi:hypothetical protein